MADDFIYILQPRRYTRSFNPRHSMLLLDKLCELDHCDCVDSTNDTHILAALQQPHINWYNEKQIDEVSMYRRRRWSHSGRAPRENAQRLWHAMVIKYEVGPRQPALDVALPICIGNARLGPLLPADSRGQPLVDESNERSFWVIWKFCPQDVIKRLPSDWFRLWPPRVH